MVCFSNLIFSLGETYEFYPIHHPSPHSPKPRPRTSRHLCAIAIPSLHSGGQKLNAENEGTTHERTLIISVALKWLSSTQRWIGCTAARKKLCMPTFARQHLKDHLIPRRRGTARDLWKFLPRRNCHPQAGWKTTHSTEHGVSARRRWLQLAFVASRWCWCWWSSSRSWWTPPGRVAMRCSVHAKWCATLTGPRPRPQWPTRWKTTA